METREISCLPALILKQLVNKTILTHTVIEKMCDDSLVLMKKLRKTRQKRESRKKEKKL